MEIVKINDNGDAVIIVTDFDKNKHYTLNNRTYKDVKKITSDEHVAFRDEFGRYDIVDHMGESVLPEGLVCYNVQRIGRFINDGIVAVRVNSYNDVYCRGLWRFLDIHTGAITEDCFNSFEASEDRTANNVIARVETNHRLNYCTFDAINREFGLLSVLWFHNASPFNNGFAVVSSVDTHKTNIIDANGNLCGNWFQTK